MTTQAFHDAFDKLIAALKVVTEYPTHYNQKPPTINYEPGKGYVRLVLTCEGSRGRHAFGFVDTTNGDVLKAAGWKGPTKNFARGNIYDEHGGLGCVHWTGFE